MSEATGRASKLERETREAEETNREASAELSRLTDKATMAAAVDKTTAAAELSGLRKEKAGWSAQLAGLKKSLEAAKSEASTQAETHRKTVATLQEKAMANSMAATKSLGVVRETLKQSQATQKRLQVTIDEQKIKLAAQKQELERLLEQEKISANAAAMAAAAAPSPPLPGGGGTSQSTAHAALSTAGTPGGQSSAPSSRNSSAASTGDGGGNRKRSALDSSATDANTAAAAAAATASSSLDSAISALNAHSGGGDSAASVSASMISPAVRSLISPPQKLPPTNNAVNARNAGSSGNRGGEGASKKAKRTSGDSSSSPSGSEWATERVAPQARVGGLGALQASPSPPPTYIPSAAVAASTATPIIAGGAAGSAPTPTVSPMQRFLERKVTLVAAFLAAANKYSYAITAGPGLVALLGCHAGVPFCACVVAGEER